MLSNKTTHPEYSFGTSARASTQKILLSKEQVKRNVGLVRAMEISASGSSRPFAPGKEAVDRCAELESPTDLLIMSSIFLSTELARARV